MIRVANRSSSHRFDTASGTPGKHERRLNYLVKVRPDAIGPYLASSRRPQALDPKTRNLISVITRSTPRLAAASSSTWGGRCAKRHARRDPGRAPHGLPALGLARSSGSEHHPRDEYSGFDPARLGAKAPPEWHDVAALAELPADGVKRLEIGDRGLFVLRTPRRSASTTAAAAPGHNIRARGQGRTLTCPKHEWTFDLETGNCIAKGTSPLNRLEHRVTGTRLEVLW